MWGWIHQNRCSHGMSMATQQNFPSLCASSALPISAVGGVGGCPRRFGLCGKGGKFPCAYICLLMVIMQNWSAVSFYFGNKTSFLKKHFSGAKDMCGFIDDKQTIAMIKYPETCSFVCHLGDTERMIVNKWLHNPLPLSFEAYIILRQFQGEDSGPDWWLIHTNAVRSAPDSACHCKPIIFPLPLCNSMLNENKN